MSAKKSSPASKPPSATATPLTSPARAANPAAAFSFSPPPSSASSAPLSLGGFTSAPFSFQATPSPSSGSVAQPLLSPHMPGAAFAFAPPALTVPSLSSPATPLAFVPPKASPSAPSPSSVFVFTPSPPKASLASLPTDLIRLILAYFPFRPRLLVVSRVCKQWRTLSLSTVTRIPKTFAPSRRFLVDVLPHCANLADFAAFTSLTTLNPQDWYNMRSFPITHLRQMNITTFHSADKVIAYTTWAARLTRLTNLTLVGGEGLIGPCVSRATSLVFEVGFKGWANLNRIVNTNLRELKISQPETDDAGERSELPLQFLLHHASQLTSLTLEGIESVDFLVLRPAPIFPQVRELFIYVMDDEFDERPLRKFLPHVPSLTELSYPANINDPALWAKVNPVLVQTSDMLEYPSPPCRLEDLGINFEDYKWQRPADLAAVQSTLRILNVENASPAMLTTFTPAVWPRLTHLVIEAMTISPCDLFFEHWRFPILRKIYIELPVSQSLTMCDRLFDRRDLLPRLYYVRIIDFEPFPAFLRPLAFDVLKKAERFGLKHLNFEGTHWEGLREYAKQRMWLDIEVDVGSARNDADEEEEEDDDDDDGDGDEGDEDDEEEEEDGDAD